MNIFSFLSLTIDLNCFWQWLILWTNLHSAHKGSVVYPLFSALMSGQLNEMCLLQVRLDTWEQVPLWGRSTQMWKLTKKQSNATDILKDFPTCNLKEGGHVVHYFSFLKRNQESLPSYNVGLFVSISWMNFATAPQEKKLTSAKAIKTRFWFLSIVLKQMFKVALASLLYPVPPETREHTCLLKELYSSLQWRGQSVLKAFVLLCQNVDSQVSCLCSYLISILYS